MADLKPSADKSKAIKHGGKRPGAGRKKGSRELATIEQRGTLSDLARAHTPDALQTLVSVAKSSDSDAARVSAAVAILDRGYGRPTQAMEHAGPNGGPIEHKVTRIELVDLGSGSSSSTPKA